MFDGSPDPSVANAYGRVRIEFSGPRSADDVIVSRVRTEPNWTVVSDDESLRGVCRRLGAQTWRVAELLQRIPPAPVSQLQGEERDPQVDVLEWQAYFESGPKE